MISVSSITRYLKSRNVLNNVSFDLKPGTITGLIGPSGSGKSTLLKIMAHVARSDEGQVEMEGCEHDEIGLMFQESALFDSLNVIDNVAFHLVDGRVPLYILPKEERIEVHKKVEIMLGRLGLTKAALKFPAQLSGGMRRRVALGRALVSLPKIALLDDPTSGLDPVASNVIMNLIVDIHREYNPTTLIVSHDLRRLIPVADTIIALFDGMVRFIGTVEELKATKDSELRRFVNARYDLDDHQYSPSSCP